MGAGRFGTPSAGCGANAWRCRGDRRRDDGPHERCDVLPGVRRLAGPVADDLRGRVRINWHADHNHQVGVTLATWAHHEDLLPTFADRIGQVVNGRVTKTVPIGTFVCIAHCVEGLIPAAAFSGPPAEVAGQAVRDGQEISVRILAVDLERRRISLSVDRVP
ncbi:S1 RNA-binding domain-containing protein [Kitasatospora sp. NPDC002551]|uniref:S1 RNA-binding domain-containing protein n=1 Tax=Kitasatospora sp. NPDC002551 TaxID=3154539 RepID=UPI0033262DEB